MRHILELKPGFAKLDISLVRGIDLDPTRRALAAGLEHFALQTEFQLIAEGIETIEEATVLQDLGIELGQGYLFGRPEGLASRTGIARP
ncbi:MAG: EAL domain-containing protein, partial [Candidatus Limnocylindrales bacterium]